MRVHQPGQHRLAAQVDVGRRDGLGQRRRALVDLRDEPSGKVNFDGRVGDELHESGVEQERRVD